ncbi:hypothetical protein [Aeromonas enteropelogenes]|uniref:hypothetical protein n=1 Tax=Aeromonas enteropelogenes TaxID=29489 RepID=UPI003BA12D73
MKVLIVDDNESRCKEIKSLLISNSTINQDDLYICKNTQSAKELMRNIKFDLLLLDVVLPKRSEIPDAKYGLALLNDIKKRPNIKKPNKIIGITAHYDDISSFRSSFDKHCEIVIEASRRNKEWKRNIIEAANFELAKKIDSLTTIKKITCLTVHGIRTRGVWQQKLQKEIESKVDTVKFESYKYGYFTILSFCIPFLRHVQISRFKIILEQTLLREEKEGRTLYIFCHSFGTYIVVKSISKIISEHKSINIDRIILAGSVLPSTYDFSKILSSSNINIINECGNQDNVLLLSEALVPNTGMAGRVGFYGMNNDRFVNRFFKGGHSHYFDEKTRFIEKNWLTLFTDQNDIPVIDQRNDPSIISRSLEKIASFLGKAKELLYLALFIYLLKTVVTHII